MSNLNFPVQPQEATKLILKRLSSRRMRDVLEKRFGLKGGKYQTLEGIGQEYRITRERVRQIEAEALKQLGKSGTLVGFEPIFGQLEAYIADHGGVVAEQEIFSGVAGERNRPHIVFLLTIARQIHEVSETESSHKRWAVDKEKATLTDKIMAGVIKGLEERSAPVSERELEALIASNAKEVIGRVPQEQETRSFLATSRLIRKNPYGEYGLSFWSLINPRGVKDKAYAVLSRNGRPLHFHEVAKAIDRAAWSKKHAHPQTVHNELIKDPRFVLVGRGLYALRDWGYEPGVVRDVMVSVLKSAGRPLVKDDVVRLVSEKRMVKAQTVLLNLQNKSVFKKTEDGKYTLV